MSWIDNIRVKKSLPDQPEFYEDPKTIYKRLAKLSTIEYKVFMFLREGFTNKESSKRLNIKQGKVKKHTKSIYKKLGVSSLAELIFKYHEYS